MTTRQSVPGTFRNFFGLAIGDANINGNGNIVLGAQYTPGATIVDAVNSQQFPSGSTWQLTTLTVRGYLGFSEGANGMWGKLGKIVTGLVLQGDSTPGDRTVFGTAHAEGGASWVSSLQSLPTDATLLTDLWNPASDPMPPQIPFLPSVAPYPSYAPNQLLPVAAVLSLPSVLQIPPQSSLAVGIWIYPSLLGTNNAQTGLLYEIQLYNATYQLVFDVS